MKLILAILLAVSCFQLYTAEESSLECIQRILGDIEGVDEVAVSEWVRGVYATFERLQENRRRCDDITIERLRDACVTAWQAQAALEIARLSNELRQITGDEGSANNFLRDAADCFGIEAPQPPEEDPNPERKNYNIY